MPDNYWWIVAGMALVTFLPRLLPMLLLKDLTLPWWLKEWLHFVPYAAFGALIFPGILTVIPEHPWVGLAAGAVAVALALVQKQILVVVAGAVMTVYVAQLFLT
ncbi:MAG: AzlD domain-containing protein [Novibacillus thermophilus]